MESLLALDKLIVAVIGLLGGIVGSLIAPWVNWGIEKRQSRRRSRYDLIRSAREYVTSRRFGIVQYTKQDHYYSLRKEFKKNSVKQFDELFTKTSNGENVAENREAARKLVLDEISKIERKWYLI